MGADGERYLHPVDVSRPRRIPRGAELNVTLAHERTVQVRDRHRGGEEVAAQPGRSPPRTRTRAAASSRSAERRLASRRPVPFVASKVSTCTARRGGASALQRLPSRLPAASATVLGTASDTITCVRAMATRSHRASHRSGGEHSAWRAPQARPGTDQIECRTAGTGELTRCGPEVASADSVNRLGQLLLERR